MGLRHRSSVTRQWSSLTCSIKLILETQCFKFCSKNAIYTHSCLTHLTHLTHTTHSAHSTLLTFLTHLTHSTRHVGSPHFGIYLEHWISCWEGSLAAAAANIEGEIVEFAYNKLTSGYFAWRKQSSHPK